MSKNIAKLNINNVDFTFKDAELRNTVSGLISEINNSNKVIATSLNDLDSRIPDISGKVDKIEGKGLSTEDYTTEEKTKLAGIAAGAEVNVQPDWNATSGAAQILNKPNIRQYNGEFATEDVIVADQNYFADRYVSITDGKNSIVLDDMDDAGITIHGHGNDGFINLIAGENIRLSTTGTYKAYYNNKEIATVDDIVQSDWNATSGAAQILNKPDITTDEHYETTIQGLGGINIGRNSAKIEIGSYGDDDETISLTSNGVDGGIIINSDTYFHYNGKQVATVDDIVQSDWNATSGAAQILNKPDIPQEVITGEMVGKLHRDDVSGSGQITIKGNSGQGFGSTSIGTAGTYTVVVYSWSATQSFGYNVTFGGNSYTLTTTDGTISDKRDFTVSAGALWSASVTQAVATGTTLIVEIYNKSKLTPVLSVGTAALTNLYNDLDGKPTLSKGTTSGSGNAVTDISVSDHKITLTKGTTFLTASDISGKADKSSTISTLSLSLDTTTYVLTLAGTKADGTTFTVDDTIDLPLESVVVDGSYNANTKEVELELKSGTTISFSIADLISGLQSEITSSNKLSADLVDDTQTTHKFTTAEEKTKLADLPTAAQLEAKERVISTSLNDLNSRIKTINDIGAEANVQSDWEELDSTSDAYIVNKPFESVNEAQFIVDSTTNELSINKDILPVDYSKQYLTFVAKENGKFTFTPKNNNVISYSIDDGKTWTEGNEVTVSNGDKILWKGSMTPSNYNGIGTFSSTCNFDVQGNIMSLLFGDDFIGQIDLTGKNYTFYRLFYQNAKVVSAENLSLPATTLAEKCYYSMFNYCTSLTTPPKLPATTLASECYYYMFQGCSVLTTTPVLPAITLADSCYQSMFSSCSALTTAPALPATTLARSCYSSMFSYCTSLITAPELPATTLAQDCYNSMFSSCSALTIAPVLPATTLASQCYCYMFSFCTSLIITPELPARTLADNCYNYMFYNCTSLTKAPELPATTLAHSCYRTMFKFCTSLTKAPELPATTLVSNCYYDMFNGCSSLNYIKAMFTTTPSTDYTNSWVNGVSSTGTFIKNSAATWDVTGVNGVPTGWNVYTDSQWKEVKHYELDALEDSLDDVHETIASALNDLDSRIETIDEVGAQANVIEAIKVNDELLPITDKTVNIYDIKYIKIHQSAVNDGEDPDEGRTGYTSHFDDNGITPEYFQDLATKYDLNQSLAFHANNSNVIFEYNDQDAGIFNYVYDKGFTSFIITDENESVDDFKTLALFLSTKNNITNLINNSREYACCIIRWDNENSKWKFQWLENYKAITPGNYNGFSEIYTITTISAYDYGGSNDHAKIVLTGKENPDTDAQINISTETDDGLRWNDRVVAVEEDCEKTKEYYSKQYLTFVAKGNGTFTFLPQNSNTISYSIDNGSNWIEDNEVAVSNGDKVLWKGSMAVSLNGIGKFSSTANFDVQGNIMSLLYGDEFIGKTYLTGKNYAFYQLFYNNAKVVSAKNLIFPATTLSNYCYYQMFGGCTSLTTAPELPATTLTDYCYFCMFEGCTSLTTAPELPATTLSSSCYSYMFNNCSSLTYIKGMFTSTPGLGYTTNWVSGVSSIGTFIKNPGATWDVRGNDGIPQYWNNYLSDEINTINNKIQKIDPLILANNEYYIQKSNSVILPLSHPDLSTQPSILPERFGKYYIYEVMVPIFGDNIINNLSNASDEEIYVYENNNESYLAFKDGGLLMNDSTIINASLIGNGVYDNPTIIKDEIIEEIDYAKEYLTFVAKESGTFTFTPNNDNVISYSIDNGLTWTEGNSISLNMGDKVLWKGVMSPTGNGIGTFSSTTNFDVQGNVMSLLWGDDFEGKIDIMGNDGAFYQLFYDTTVVSAKNLILPATTLVDRCYQSMFDGCMSLTTTPELPATTLADNCYDSMFKNCTSLTTATSILPATILANSCYDSMFFNCYSLKTAPELPAITLVSNCYHYMFYGCSSLNYIRAMFTTTPSSTYTDKWVITVSSTGTFLKNSAATWNVTGYDGIPTGWTVDMIAPYTYYEYSTTGIIDQFKINKIYTTLPLSTYASKMNYLLVKYYNDKYLDNYYNEYAN